MRGLGWPSERPRRSDDRSIARRRDLAALVTAGSTAPLCLATLPPLVVLSLFLGTAGPASDACVVVPIIGAHLHKTVTRTHKLRHQQIN